MEETNKEGTAVPSHVEVVRLEHGADAGEENVDEQQAARVRYRINMFVAAHF